MAVDTSGKYWALPLSTSPRSGHAGSNWWPGVFAPFLSVFHNLYLRRFGQAFKNERGGDDAKAQYRLNLKVCNPDC